MIRRLFWRALDKAVDVSVYVVATVVALILAAWDSYDRWRGLPSWPDDEKRRDE